MSLCIPVKQLEGGASVYSSSSKSVEVSDTSVLASSLTRDLSQSPSQGSMKEVVFSYHNFQELMLPLIFRIYPVHLSTRKAIQVNQMETQQLSV